MEAVDHYREGVLDLIYYIEWEESELFIGEEQTLIDTGHTSYSVEFAPDFEPTVWQPPVNEVR